MFVARTSFNRVISSGDLYCCLLPRCKALRTCRPGFPIAAKWCSDQDVKVVRSSAFTQRTCDRCGSLWKGGDVLAISQVVLRWLCDSPRTGCAWRITPLSLWREQAITAWSRRVISIVACCHGAKLWAHAALGFPIATVLRLCNSAETPALLALVDQLTSQISIIGRTTLIN